MNFSDTIKTFSKQCLISHSDFANEIGVSFSTLNRWENDEAFLKLCKLNLIKNFCVKKDIPFNLDIYVFENDKNRTE